MRKFLSVFFLCFALTSMADGGVGPWPTLTPGQSAMAHSFIAMPGSLTPYIDASMRRDMVDFYAVGSKKGVTNLLMGQSSIDEITDTSFFVSLSSDKSTLSARRYQTAKGDTLYAVIATVSVPSPDSSVRFFDSDWNPLEDDAFFTSPRVCDFAVNPKDKSARQALEAIPFALFRLSFTPDGAIAAELSADYLPDEIKASVTQHITAAPRLYVWNGKRFVCE